MIIENEVLEEGAKVNANGDIPRMYRESEYQLALPNELQPLPNRTNIFKKIGWVFQGLWHTFRPSQFRRHLSKEHCKYVVRRYGMPTVCVGALLYWLTMYTPFERKNVAAQAEATTQIKASWLPTAAPTEANVATAEVPLAKIPNATQSSKSGALIAQLQGVSAAKQEAFLARFGKVAQDEMQKFGVPASITLAFAIAYTQFGSSSLATTHHNYFAIQCNENQFTIGVSGKTTAEFNPDFCFAHFENAWSSFRTHSQILVSEPYRELAEVAKNDYWVWALGLERLGYRQHDASFSAESLREIIETFGLQRFDALP
jgi:flagellum-specific peptidoglycan hydrolase FlgJ